MLTPAKTDKNRKNELARKKRDPKAFGMATRFNTPAPRGIYGGLPGIKPQKETTDDLGI